MIKQKRSTYRTASLSDILEKAMEVFNGNKDKVYNWYVTGNPLYGNMSTYEYCKKGHVSKVFRDLARTLF